ncbi:GGDEF domain-containing protein [Acetobacterium wieringae]|uniref:GGDEF domain-containing protein n=1 Tax=Acetobacterium wieringae TaxID=52694 RepID=A0A5D0WI71_9FIRM|nr:diguanylate cyclase [Acetobacterium wieringae]TYC83930.1 GGDEF domain-containing protein [Acetobacterium wieringae]
MISRIISINQIETLKKWLQTEEIKNQTKRSMAVFVQIFSARSEPQWLTEIEAAIRVVAPLAVIVGSSTMGEISEGRLLTNTSVISFVFFEKTGVQGFLVDTKNQDEALVGKNLSEKIESQCQKIAGVLLLATSSSMDVSHFLKGFSAGRRGTYPVFGAGAGVYEGEQKPIVTLNHHFSSSGVVAVVFTGDDIDIVVHTYLGWEPLSKELTLTETDGLWLKTIDNQPAFEVYHRYLNIEDDENFFLNVLEFPLLVERNGVVYAKTPNEVKDHHDIKFIADIKQGESARIGYGNPAMIIQNARAIQDRVQAFHPEGIFIYSCTCRRFLLQNEVELETKAFQTIAPSAGFYTHGEIVSHEETVMLLNATMVTVSMKEGVGKPPEAVLETGPTELRTGQPCNRRDNRMIARLVKFFSRGNAGGGRKAAENGGEKLSAEAMVDPFNRQNNRIISQLVNFIKVVTAELEQANQEARLLAERDYLTQVYNRLKGHELLQSEITRCNRYGQECAIIMLDVDFFKQVNDTYGHNIGDAVLVQLVKLLAREIRSVDVLCRWGGEEFLVLMPQIDAEGAKNAAERLRAVVEATPFTQGLRQTASFGVTTYKQGESPEAFIDRADKALYEAKQKGRNCVVLKLGQP